MNKNTNFPCNKCGSNIYPVYIIKPPKSAPTRLGNVFYCEGCNIFGEITITLNKNDESNE